MPAGVWRLWLIHTGFVGLYVWVAWSRWGAARAGHVFFTSIWVDLAVTLPAVVLALALPRLVRGRVGYRGERLLVWTFSEVPVLVGLVGFLSGGTIAAFAWHIGLTLLLMAWTVPRLGSQVVDPVR